MSLAVALATAPARLGGRFVVESRGAVLARARLVAVGLLLLSAGALAAAATRRSTAGRKLDSTPIARNSQPIALHGRWVASSAPTAA